MHVKVLSEQHSTSNTNELLQTVKVHEMSKRPINIHQVRPVYTPIRAPISA